ncbi:unnamed protein product [marine sediment metagenome]|uniref:Uncharacterized protein n=1 Tax=marine sediment metagenome TaxID=412755 RepID=X1JC18_9ZZZZ
MQYRQSAWAKIIEAVTRPLGFYVLALLIVEGFLTLVLTFSNISTTAREYGMWAGIGLFLLVFIVVSLLAWFKPENLIFAEYGRLVHNGKIPYGTNEAEVPRTELDKVPKTKEQE